MKTILLTGKNGQVGHELVTALTPLGRVVATGREQLDLARPDSIVSCVREVRPDIIVNAAGFTAVDGAELDPDAAWQANAVGPGILAEQAKAAGALLVHYSTDYVYDGTKGAPYVEDDPTNPVNAYGRSKLEGEGNIAASGCRHLTFRTSWLYADRGTNFLLTILQLSRQRRALQVVEDQIGSPTWVRALAETTVSTLLDSDLDTKLGTYHLSADGHTSRHAFAEVIVRLAAELSNVNDGWAQLIPCTTEKFPRPAKRPLIATTSKKKFRRGFGHAMTHWAVQLRACMETLHWKQLLPPPISE